MGPATISRFSFRRLALIKPLSEIGPADAATAGSKAYHCALLRRAGLPVPDGFVVLHGSPGRLVPRVELKRALALFPSGTLFAVRSSASDEDSADASFAGLHATSLHVGPDGVEDAVKQCWASMQSSSAEAYRKKRSLARRGTRMAVLVQPMVPAEAAGVAFTADPITGATDRLIVNAARGLGEAVVAGTIEPDEFHIDKVSRRVIQAIPGTREGFPAASGGGSGECAPDSGCRGRFALDEQSLVDLANLLLRVEAVFGAPQDIEWCYGRDGFWIVQSRPITTMPLGIRQDLQWSCANIGEGLPSLPAPQVSDFIAQLFNRALPQVFGALLAPPTELGPMVKVFYGRPYLNLSQFRRLCAVTGQPAAPVLRKYGGTITPEDEDAPRPQLRRLVRAVPVLLRLLSAQLTLKQSVPRHVRRIQQRLAESAALDPQAASDEEIVTRLQIPDDVRSLIGPIAAGSDDLFAAIVAWVCRRKAISFEYFMGRSLAAGKMTANTEFGLALLDMAHLARQDGRARSYFERASTDYSDYRAALEGTGFLANFLTFLEHHGHHSNYEKDWSSPRYSEDPVPLLRVIAENVRSPECPTSAELRASREQGARDAWDHLASRLHGWKKPLVLGLVRWAVAQAKDIQFMREFGQSERARGVADVRRWHLALAARFVQRGWVACAADYFFLYLHEVQDAVLHPERAARYRRVVERRKAAYRRWQDISMPMTFWERDLGTLHHDGVRLTADLKGGGALRGVCVSPGRVQAEVAVLRNPGEFAKMRRGAIIVAPCTDPSWVPLFTLAAGVITEVGGTLSHAATIAREYGLPAISNVLDACETLQDGDLVLLDATAGSVEVL